jgi:integrase
MSTASSFLKLNSLNRRSYKQLAEEESLLLSKQAYRNFVNSINSQATKRTYVFALQKFMQFLNLKDIEQLINNYKDQTKLIESQIIDFIVTLKNPPFNLSFATRSTYMAAICTFYVMNDIILNRKKIGKYLGEQVRAKKDRAYTIEEIRRLLEVCDERQKVIVLLLASTGMRLGALCALEVQHLIKWPEFQLYQITVYEGTKDEYYCFTTPECSKAIDLYFEYRQRCGEDLTPNSPLIREQFDKNDEFQTRHPRKVSVATCGRNLMNSLLTAGLYTRVCQTESHRTIGVERKEVARANGFRKYMNTNFVRAKINPFVKEMLLGHSTHLDDHYFRPSTEEVVQQYLSAVNLLTINEANRLKLKLKDLTEKTKDNDYIIKTKLLEKDDQLNNMQDQFAILQSQVHVLISTLGSIGVSSKNEIAKQLIQKGMYKSADQNPETSKLI